METSEDIPIEKPKTMAKPSVDDGAKTEVKKDSAVVEKKSSAVGAKASDAVEKRPSSKKTGTAVRKTASKKKSVTTEKVSTNDKKVSTNDKKELSTKSASSDKLSKDVSPIQSGELKGSLAHYRKVVAPKLLAQFKYRSAMQLPAIKKLVLNIGLGEAKNNRAVLTDGLSALSSLAGQKAVSTKAKNSIAGFKIREEMAIGAMVTLRGVRLYDFLVRLVHVALPRVKDFHGLPKKGFDGRGNFTLGIKDSSVFPELAGMYGTKAPGLSVSFVTTAETNEESLALLESMGMPFVLEKKKK